MEKLERFFNFLEYKHLSRDMFQTPWLDLIFTRQGDQVHFILYVWNEVDLVSLAC